MSEHLSSTAYRDNPRQSVQLPYEGREGSFVREAGSIAEMAEMMRDIRTKAAFFHKPPTAEERSLFDSLLKKNTRFYLWGGSFQSRDPLYSLEAYFSRVNELLQDYADRPSQEEIAGFNRFLEREFTDVKDSFPEYRMGVTLQRGTEGGKVAHWHRDPRISEKYLRIVKVLRGGSCEYAEDEAGSNAVIPPPESVGIHRGGCQTYYGAGPIKGDTGAWHRETQSISSNRLKIVIDLSPFRRQSKKEPSFFRLQPHHSAELKADPNTDQPADGGEDD